MVIKDLIAMLDNAGMLIGYDCNVYISDNENILRVVKDVSKIYEDIVVLEMGGTQ